MIIFIFLVVLVLLYIYLLISYNDFGVPSLELKNFLDSNKKNNVLVIYPHPDDETMASGGLIVKFQTEKNVNLYVVTVTTGQKGTELIKLPPKELGELRLKEFSQAMKALGVKNLEAWDFMDGDLTNNIEVLQRRINDFIVSKKIDLIVTYEKSGVYGHPDHIALSYAVNKAVIKTGIKALYSTLSDKIAKKVSFPTQIDGVPIPEFDKPEKAEFKISTIKENLRKYKAAKSYKSQKLSGDYPLALVFIVNIFEYYTTKFNSDQKI